MSLEIYQFVDPVIFANHALEQRQIANPRFSLRGWARQLGYNSPSYLAQVLKRQRKFKIDLAKKIALNLKMKPSDQRYLEALVLLQNCKTAEERSSYTSLLEGLCPGNAPAFRSLQYDQFRLMSDWIHVAILEVVNLKDFDGSIEFIEGRLGLDIGKRALEQTVERLVRLQFLKKKNGKLSRSNDAAIEFDQEVSDIAVQQFHAQILDKAKEALSGQSISERDFRSSALSLKTADLKRAREILKRAHQELSALNSDGSGDDVYQISTQAFRLTKRGIRK